MTDAYEDVFSTHGDHSEGKVATRDGGGDDSSAHRQQTHNQKEPGQRGGHIEAAELRRKEFRAWLLHRARHSSEGNQPAIHYAASEERQGRSLERLQERLAAAEANRAACLARLQRRAAAISQRREDAAERAAAAAAERITTAAGRLEADLAAAESRRLALREAEIERLRAEHELVLSRLVSIQERTAAGAEEQRSRLEARLRSAASEREARLARRAARAAGKVERARALGAQTREMQQQETESRRQALEQKLETARRRREDRRLRTSGSGAGAAASGTLAADAAAADHGTCSATPSSPTASTHSAQDDTQSPSPSPSPSQSVSRSLSESPARSPERTASPAATAAADIVTVADRPRTPTALSSGALTFAEELRDGNRSAGEGNAGALVIAEPEETWAETPEGGDAVATTEAGTEISSRLEGLRRSISSRRLQQVWRVFVQSKRTTRTLAEAFVAQGVTGVRLPTPLQALSPTAAVTEDAAARAAGAVDVPRRQGQGGRQGVAPIVIGLGTSSGSPGAAALARLRMQGQGLTVGRHDPSDDGGDGFDRFASALRSPATLKATQALMRRLEQRLAARLAAPPYGGGPKGGGGVSSQGHGHGGGGPGSSLGSYQGQSAAATSVSRLLRRLYPTAPRDAKLERYPPRVLLCAFMIVQHPEVVFSGSGAREVALAAAARDLVDRFEALLERIILVPAEPVAGTPTSAAEPAGPLPLSPTYHIAASPVARGMEELLRRRRATAAAAVLGGGFELPPSPSSLSPYMTIGSLLVQFDDAWLRYLDQFVAWKGADAASLEAELVRCAAALEASMLRKCRGDPASERVRRSSDLQAVIAQVAHDLSLLRERISKLGGEAGLARLEAALEATRRAVAAEIAERGTWSGGSTSAATSELDSTDAESTPRHGRRRRSAAAAARSPSASSNTSPVLSRQATPPAPLVLPVESAAACSGGAAAPNASPLAAAAHPLSTAPVPIAPSGRPGTSSTPYMGAGGTARVSASGGDAAAAGVPPSPLSASPRSPGSLRASLLGPDADASGGGGGAIHAPPLDAALVSNASLVHEMLLGANTGSYRLPISEAEAAWSRAVAAMSQDAGGLAVLAPGPDSEELRAMDQEQLIRALRSRTAAIAECAFWDNVIATLAVALQPRPTPAGSTRGSPGGRLAVLLAPLLSEVAYDVASVVNNPQQASAVRTEFAEATLRSQIEGGPMEPSPGGGVSAVVAAVQRALGVLQRLAGLLVAAGAPVREDAALAAQRTMRERLAAALEDYATQQQQLQLSAPGTAKPSRHSAGDAGVSDESSESDGDGEGAAAASLKQTTTMPLAAALGRAVRLLAAQVKLLKVDAANGRLQALATRLQGNGGVEYLRSKFAAIFRLEGAANAPEGNAGASAAPASGSGLPPPRLPQGQDLFQLLPRTSTWLRRSRAAAGGIATYIRGQGIDMEAAVAAAATAIGGGAPVSLRAGLRPPPGGSGAAATTSNAAATTKAPSVPPIVPVGPDGARAGTAWRWVVRCGLVGLVASDSPAVGPSLAETLLWDGERLHAAQNQFQQLVVVTAGLLLVTQLRATAVAAARAAAPDAAAAAAAASIAAAAWGPDARAAAARRLLVVVADPGMRLPDLTSELSLMAGVAGDDEAEGRLRAVFMSLVEPGSTAFRSINNALAAALVLYITLGTPLTHGLPVAGGPAAAASVVLLGRVGASGLAADVAALGEQLLALCAVNEAVHGDLYREMYEKIVEQESAVPSAVVQPQPQNPVQQVQLTAADTTAGSRADVRQAQQQQQQQQQQQPPLTYLGHSVVAAGGGEQPEAAEEEEERLAEDDEI